MRRSCKKARRVARARDYCVAAHGTGQQDQQWRIRQLVDSCINIILPSRIPIIIFYFVLLQIGERLELQTNTV